MRVLLFIFIATAFPIGVNAQTDYYMVSEEYRTKMFNRSNCVVNARVIERGCFVRMEEGVFYGSIKCEITEWYKGRLRKGKTLRVHVKEFDNRPLGGKLTDDDEGVYRIGQCYVFFLEKQRVDDYEGNPEYRPVDDVKGIMKAAYGLRQWLLERSR